MDDDYFLLASGNINISSISNNTNSIAKQTERKTDTSNKKTIKPLIKKHNRKLISLLKQYIIKQTTNNEVIDELFYKLFVEIENK
jgi:hypothetical protein